MKKKFFWILESKMIFLKNLILKFCITNFRDPKFNSSQIPKFLYHLYSKNQMFEFVFENKKNWFLKEEYRSDQNFNIDWKIKWLLQ